VTVDASSPPTRDRAGWLRRHAIDVRPLRHPPFRRMFVGEAVSFFGYQFTAVAVPVQVYRMTGSSLWVGLLGLAGLVPLLLFAPWGGAITDRLDRRRVLLVSSLLAWCATLALLGQALLGLRSPYLILGVVAVQAAAFAVSNPARQAILPSIVTEPEVASANTLGFTVANAATVIGPLVAGLVITGLSVSTAYAVDAVAFTVALWAAARLPALPAPADADDTPTTDHEPTGPAGPVDTADRNVVAGLRYLAASPLILLTFAIDIAAMVLAMPRALFPEVAAERFGAGSIGWLYSSIAIGSVLAGLTSGWIARLRRQGVAIIVAVALWGLAVAAAGAAPWLWLVVTMLAVAGAADLVSAVYRQTLLLTYAPAGMQGRLQGVFFAVVAGGPRLGDLRVGAMAQWLGPTVAWVSGGLAAAVVALILGAAFPVLRRYVPTRS
jgi:MFS family permease